MSDKLKITKEILYAEDVLKLFKLKDPNDRIVSHEEYTIEDLMEDYE